MKGALFAGKTKMSSSNSISRNLNQSHFCGHLQPFSADLWWPPGLETLLWQVRKTPGETWEKPSSWTAMPRGPEEMPSYHCGNCSWTASPGSGRIPFCCRCHLFPFLQKKGFRILCRFFCQIFTVEALDFFSTWQRTDPRSLLIGMMSAKRGD